MEHLFIIIIIIIFIKLFFILKESYKINENFTDVLIDNDIWNNKFKNINKYIYNLQDNLKNYSYEININNSIDGIDEIIVDELDVTKNIDIKKSECDPNIFKDCMTKA